MPYLGTYVERTHDLGTARSLLRLLILNMARYENGGRGRPAPAFRQLSGYGEVLEGLNQLDDAALMKLLRENDFTQAARQDQFAERLAARPQQALRGACGADVREAFQEIVRAMLVNESVYMPLHHRLFPLEWKGKMRIRSCGWTRTPRRERRKPGTEGKIQFLFKLDIRILGFLEMTLAADGRQVDLQSTGRRRCRITASDRRGSAGDSVVPRLEREERPGDQAGEAAGI